MAGIILEKLRKAFPQPRGERVAALDGLTLEVADGELLILAGPSGCGKTTTLRLIAGLEEPDGGTITMGGRVVNGVPPSDRDVAMVFQHHALFPHLTAYENLALGLKLRKVPRAEIEVRVREAAELLGLSPLLNRRPEALSGGERQRVAVGRAIVRRPKVFLFDEPLAGLDAGLRSSLRMELARLHDRLGATMVYVTHDQVEALSLGDRLAVMRPGGIQQVGPPMEVYQRPANLFVAGFLGLPPMNLLAAELVDGGGAIDFHDSRGGSQRLSTSPSWRACLRARGAGPVMLGVRPEHISLSTWVDGRVGIPGTVEGSESMGTETLVHVLVSGQRVIARLPAQQRFSRGDRVELRFDVEQAHFFDPKSGSILK